MEQISQELNIENYDIKSIKKLFNQSCNHNNFLNTYTLLDVEEGKKRLYLDLLRKYNYQHKDYIQGFIDNASNMLVNEIFSSENGNVSTSTNQRNTQMVGIKNIIKDTRELNRNYFNEIYRIVSIDSMYDFKDGLSTNMMVELNDTLDNVVALELTNINIPFTFYNIDQTHHNNYFYISVDGGSSVKIEIEEGNYDTSTLVQEINTALGNSGNAQIQNITFSLVNNKNNKVKIENGNGSEVVEVIFCDPIDRDMKFNNNLGHILGFRQKSTDNSYKMSYELNASESATSEELSYVSHTKYFVIVIDDMNKNQTNKDLVQISNDVEHMKKTNYYENKNDKNLDCITDDNIQNYMSNDTNPSRRLTKNQIYSSLQIKNHTSNIVTNKHNNIDNNGIGNVFGIIPFESKNLEWGKSMFTSDKNRFKRKYNGPVDIHKLKVQLLDDKGNVLNLNGQDWSMTLISTHLYQY